MAIMTIIVVLFLSTSLFRLVQISLNRLWKVREHWAQWKKMLLTRAISLLLILITTALFFASAMIELGLQLFGDYLSENVFEINLQIINTVVDIINFFLTIGWFALLYKLLPDVRIKWKPAIIGAAVTTALFMLGKFILWYAVVDRDLDTIFGVAASIIVVALWLFYASIIFFYGAAFTKVYSYFIGLPLQPADYAHRYEIKEIYDE